MKDKIIKKTSELLNESGVNQTSFRTIGAALGLSDGHIRYYFKTKEILLLAVFEKMNQEILLASTPVPDDLSQISAHLKKNLQEAFKVMADYSFFFTETPATFSQFAQVGQYYRNLVQGRKALFTDLFTQLISRGFFKADFSPSQQQQAFYSIFLISDSWIRYYYIIHGRKPDHQAAAFHSELAFSILIPYIER